MLERVALTHVSSQGFIQPHPFGLTATAHHTRSEKKTRESATVLVAPPRQPSPCLLHSSGQRSRPAHCSPQGLASPMAPVEGLGRPPTGMGTMALPPFWMRVTHAEWAGASLSLQDGRGARKVA